MLQLPNKDLFRISEIAEFFSVSDRCIRLWVEHGHLTAVKIVGSIRITRESAINCRFFNHKNEDEKITTIDIQKEPEKPEKRKYTKRIK